MDDVDARAPPGASTPAEPSPKPWWPPDVEPGWRGWYRKGWVLLLVGVGVAWIMGLPSIAQIRSRNFTAWPWEPLLRLTDFRGDGSFSSWLLAWGLVAALGTGAAWLLLRLASADRRGRLLRTSATVVSGAVVTGIVLDVLFVASFFVSVGPLGSFGASNSEMECWGGLHDEATWTEAHLWNATSHLSNGTRPPAGFDYDGPIPGPGASLTKVQWQGIRIDPGGLVTIELEPGLADGRHAARFASFARNATSADDATIAGWTAVVANRTFAGEDQVFVAISDLDLGGLARRLGLEPPGGNATVWGPQALRHGSFTTAPPVGHWEGTAEAADGNWTFTFLMPTRAFTLPGEVQFSVDAGGRAHAEIPDFEARESTVVARVQSALVAAGVTAVGPAPADVPIGAIC